MERLNLSNSSTDTEALLKITPQNIIDNAEFENEKSYFSNENSFMKEIDNFLSTNQKKDVLNSTRIESDLLSYANFADPLKDSQSSNNQQQQQHVNRQQHSHTEDQDINLQLLQLYQKKMQISQQKISLLTRSNLEKDDIIKKLKSNEGLDQENQILKQKITKLESEIAETISLIKKFQEKNEILELKIENLTLNSQEISDVKSRQIKDLEVRLSNSLKIEKELQKEVEELKSKCKEEKENVHKEKIAKTQVEREVTNLKSQLKQAKDERIKLHERFEDDKKTTELKQKKVFSNLLSEFASKESKLVSEFDSQREALKNYYQLQLETALEEKVKEFQNQLNLFQEELKIEADERERLATDRVLSQMEMIMRKNEEEIDLIKRKCAEEVNLYRVQLINATKTIENLETKLGDYQSKRQNIADNLHSIMESQWKKIVDVLTCPSRPVSQMEEISESDNNKQYYMPIRNNLSRSEENLKSELLRNYIDQLLKQPPKINDDVNRQQKMNSRKSRNAVKPWKPN